MLGVGGIVLDNEETAEAVRDSIKSTILNSGQHLDVISKVAKDLYLEYKLEMKPRSSITLAKLISGHIVTDSCTTAQITNYVLVDDVIDTAREDWMAEKGKQDVMREANGGVLPEGVAELPPLKFYTVLCWYHLRNVWFKGID